MFSGSPPTLLHLGKVIVTLMPANTTVSQGRPRKFRAPPARRAKKGGAFLLSLEKGSGLDLGVGEHPSSRVPPKRHYTPLWIFLRKNLNILSFKLKKKSLGKGEVLLFPGYTGY